jgi:hypothetical protein
MAPTLRATSVWRWMTMRTMRRTTRRGMSEKDGERCLPRRGGEEGDGEEGDEQDGEDGEWEDEEVMILL